MGLLKQALTQVSSHSAKKTGVWERWMDRITDCVTDHDILMVELEASADILNIPPAYVGPLMEVIEKRKEEIASEDIGLILREKYDF